MSPRPASGSAAHASPVMGKHSPPFCCPETPGGQAAVSGASGQPGVGLPITGDATATADRPAGLRLRGCFPPENHYYSCGSFPDGAGKQIGVLGPERISRIASPSTEPPAPSFCCPGGGAPYPFLRDSGPAGASDAGDAAAAAPGPAGLRKTGRQTSAFRERPGGKPLFRSLPADSAMTLKRPAGIVSRSLP